MSVSINTTRGKGRSVSLRANGPIDFEIIPRRSLGQHTRLPLPYLYTQDSWKRLFWRSSKRWLAVEVMPARTSDTLRVSLRGDCDPEYRETVIGCIRYCFGLDLPIPQFYAVAAHTPIWSRIAADLRGLRPHRSASPFESLIKLVIRQLISASAARTLVARLVLECGPRVQLSEETYYDFPGPGDLHGTSPARLRNAGIGYKVGLIKALTNAAVRGDLNLLTRSTANEQTLLSKLRGYPGIGDWTCKVFAFDGLGGPDYPLDDITIRRSVGGLVGTAEVPPPLEDVLAFAAPVGKFQALAATYLFGSYWLQKAKELNGSPRRAGSVRRH